MNLRSIIFTFSIIYLSILSISANEPEYFHLASEPLVRIGLSTNARSVSISTSDIQLVSASPDEQMKTLAATKITVTARAYRPPEIEIYNFEIQNVESQTEADDLAKDIRDATNQKTAILLDAKSNKWSIRIGETIETIEEANQYKTGLADKGFEDVVIVTEKIPQPSDDAVALSQQLKTGGKTEVRSLIKTTGSTTSTTTDRKSVV